MAEVFEAELVGDLGFVRKVALKRMLESAAADAVAARRFLDEAVIASRLHHANVVSVVDLGTLDDRPFQVLEFVDGIDAHRLLQRAGGKLPAAVALAIANDVAHALDHAHAAADAAGLPLGIVHRDVKPSNVLVSWNGDVKLGDFGIAVARDRGATTEAGVVAGTAGFMAPEQRARSPLDGRTDVFALGLTLHALLTGDSPFRDIEIEIRALAGEPVPIDPSLPDDIRALLGRALSIARTDRPTAAELASQIGGVLAPRLTGDRRTLVRNFLAEHAPPKSSPRGALDALLGIEVVLTGGSDLPRYETRAAAAPSESTTSPALRASGSPDDDEPTRVREAGARADDGGDGSRAGVASKGPRAPATARAPTGEPPQQRRRLGPLLAIGGLAIGAGVVAWRLRGGPAPPSDAAVAGVDAAVVAIADTQRADTAAPITPPIDAAVAIDAAPVARDTRAPIARDARIPNADARTVVVEAAAPIDAALAIGYVLVTGEELIGAAVLIDGKHAGSVPNPIAVTHGSHRVEVVKRDGTRLPPRTVQVTPMHNRANPARATW